MDIPAGTIIAARYRVLRELGRGGMGAVYLVEHINTGDHAALKVMLGTGHVDMEALERFKREARAPAKIKSEHVVKVLDADTAPELGGAPFLVMELLQGTDLQTLVRRRGRLGADEVVDFLRQASIALDKSHALGIVHRDLKPENLFLHGREDGSICVKILDFGISKILPQASASAMPMTALGSVMGTPLFMAPEQARGAVHMIGPQTDVWAIGLIAVHLLTGEHYWGHPQNLTELMTSIIRCDLYPPTSRWPFLPPLFDAWLLRSCAREPAQRFSSVGEQIAALAQALDVSGPAAASAGATLTDPLGATAAAPSAQTPRPAPTQPMGYQPQMPPSWNAEPHMIVGGSTTGAGAISRPASIPETQRGGRPSVFAAVAIGVSLFILVTGVGLGVVLYMRKPEPAAPQAPTATQVVATATSEDTALPALRSKPQPHVPAPPTTASASHTPPAASTSATPRTTATATKKSKHDLCIEECARSCNDDPDPIGCAKPCLVDCP
jgi:serine/threonine-protein kinase